jgi:hypothetical protein
MFLKSILVALFIFGIVAGESTNPKAFLQESAKRLDALVKKKKQNVKAPIAVSEEFDEFVNDTNDLLETLDKQCVEDSKSEKKQEIIQMITSNMVAMENLLSRMNISKLDEPLKDYGKRTSDDPNWDASCNRPSKRASQRENAELKRKRLEEASDNRAALRKATNDSELQDGAQQ